MLIMGIEIPFGEDELSKDAKRFSYSTGTTMLTLHNKSWESRGLKSFTSRTNNENESQGRVDIPHQAALPLRYVVYGIYLSNSQFQSQNLKLMVSSVSALRSPLSTRSRILPTPLATLHSFAENPLMCQCVQIGRAHV